MLRVITVGVAYEESCDLSNEGMMSRLEETAGDAVERARVGTILDCHHRSSTTDFDLCTCGHFSLRNKRMQVPRSGGVRLYMYVWIGPMMILLRATTILYLHYIPRTDQ